MADAQEDKMREAFERERRRVEEAAGKAAAGPKPASDACTDSGQPSPLSDLSASGLRQLAELLAQLQHATVAGCFRSLRACLQEWPARREDETFRKEVLGAIAVLRPAAERILAALAEATGDGARVGDLFPAESVDIRFALNDLRRLLDFDAGFKTRKLDWAAEHAESAMAAADRVLDRLAAMSDRVKGLRVDRGDVVLRRKQGNGA